MLQIGSKEMHTHTYHVIPHNNAFEEEHNISYLKTMHLRREKKKGGGVFFSAFRAYTGVQSYFF